MRINLLLKALIATTLLAACVHAEVMYTIPASKTDSDSDSVEGFVDFFLTGCSSSGQTGCVLNIELENTYTGTEAANNAISGVTFELSNASTILNFVGTLGSSLASNRSGGSVSTIKQSNGTVSTLSGVGSWQVQSDPDTGTWGTNANSHFALDNTPSSTAKDLIVTSSAGGFGVPGTDSSFRFHTPSLEGPVYFQISGISGLTSSTDISNIVMLFGDSGSSSSPTGDFLQASTTCAASGSGSCLTGDIGYELPEPMSFFLAGSGLLALLCLRRRSPAAPVL